MTTHQLVVLTGGMGQPSTSRLLADRLADAVRESLALREEQVEVAVFELRELAHDTTRALVNQMESEALLAAKQAVIGADALIVVNPVFNGGVSGIVKSFLDLFTPDDLTGKPVLLGATGGSERHSLVLEYALRPIFTHLRTWTAPTGVFAATGDWGSGAGPTERIRRAGGELAELIMSRPQRKQADPYDDVVPFAQLLG
ncbi:CE1759 family FMN reductase [Propionibacteriaceae bacterium Y2011]